MLPDDGRVVSNFIVQALRGSPLTVFGDGSQTRSFCYVDDLVDGLLLLMETPHDVTGPINLGNPTELTVLELAGQVLKSVGGSSGIKHRPLPPDDPVRRCPAIDEAERVLNWKPTTPLADGLEHTVRYFRETLGLLCAKACA
ncbi:MAG TPA: NAD-dependent epimerase/dehydratase family protein [Streptosporangiaceae bacterium]|nr:NAD-dependent epimerase/dehydratase family protein [Streptosporangiaceae bacterium]